MSLEDEFIELYDRSENFSLGKEVIKFSTERYTNFKKISSGGMKSIYQVFDEHCQRYVAFACLTEKNSEKLNEMFLNEAHLTAKLAHPNIIPIYDIGVDKNEDLYFTMELKTGDSLQEILNNLKKGEKNYKEKYTKNVLLNIFLKVCEAVEYAHHHEILHLDIKPDNIQVDQDGRVMLCDWGLASVYSSQGNGTTENHALIQSGLLNVKSQFGEIKGTPGYMAPELAEVNSVKSVETDIYSLGALLYSMLALTPPYRGDFKTILAQTKAGNYQKLNKFKTHSSLIAIVDKALSFKKKDRYQFVIALKSDIENHMKGFAPQAENASTFTKIKLFVLRNQQLCIVTSLSLGIFFLLIYYFFLERNMAKTSLELLNLQKSENKNIIQKKQSQMVKKVMDVFHIEILDKPKIAVQKAKKELAQLQTQFGYDQKINLSLGYLNFISHDFEKVEEYLENQSVSNNPLLLSARKFKDLKGGKVLLRGSDFVKLLEELEPYSRLHLEMLLFFKDTFYNLKANLDGLKIILRKLNPNWTPGFQYSKDHKKLILKGKGLSKLGDVETPLRSLPINVLDISETNIESLNFLKYIHVKVLNISYLNLSFNELNKIRTQSIEKVVISKDQFSENNLKRLPKRIKIEQGNGF